MDITRYIDTKQQSGGFKTALVIFETLVCYSIWTNNELKKIYFFYSQMLSWLRFTNKTIPIWMIPDNELDAEDYFDSAFIQKIWTEMTLCIRNETLSVLIVCISISPPIAYPCPYYRRAQSYNVCKMYAKRFFFISSVRTYVISYYAIPI